MRGLSETGERGGRTSVVADAAQNARQPRFDGVTIRDTAYRLPPTWHHSRFQHTRPARQKAPRRSHLAVCRAGIGFKPSDSASAC